MNTHGSLLFPSQFFIDLSKLQENNPERNLQGKKSCGGRKGAPFAQASCFCFLMC